MTGAPASRSMCVFLCILACVPTVVAAEETDPCPGQGRIAEASDVGYPIGRKICPGKGFENNKDKPLLYGSCPESPFPFLKQIDRTGDPEGVTKLNPDFACRLMQFIKAVGGNITIVSGYRSIAKQEKLYADDIRSHGGKPSGLVAPPGSSKHNYGEAVDLHYDGQFPNKFGKSCQNHAWCIKYLPSCRKAFEIFSQFNLTYPMCYEPWHIEPAGNVQGGVQNPGAVSGTGRNTASPDNTQGSGSGGQQKTPPGGWKDDSGNSYNDKASLQGPSQQPQSSFGNDISGLIQSLLGQSLFGNNQQNNPSYPFTTGFQVPPPLSIATSTPTSTTPIITSTSTSTTSPSTTTKKDSTSVHIVNADTGEQGTLVVTPASELLGTSTPFEEISPVIVIRNNSTFPTATDQPTQITSSTTSPLRTFANRIIDIWHRLVNGTN